jgi:uncharacterized protein
MDKEQIIAKTAEYVKEKFSSEGTGHDWWHIYRVWKNAINIGQQENVDMFVVELGALLHDIADWKFNNGDDEIAGKVAREWLTSLGTDENTIAHVCEIVKNVSFKGAGVANKINTKEGMVVQDADRLDATGAMGISRTFAYGGSVNREIHNPDVKPEKHDSFEQYKKGRSSSINHFYEKLLLLKDLMNTGTAKKIAEKRHAYMEEFLNEFFEEWEGKDSTIQ